MASESNTPSTSGAPAAASRSRIRPVVLVVLMLPLLAGGVMVSGYFAGLNQKAKRKKQPVPMEELLSLRAENTLLKKMLGQVEGRVAVLGPASAGGTARGKLVWDEALQRGYLYADHLPLPLPQGKALYLWAWSDRPNPVPCARIEVSGEGPVTRAFAPSERLLKVRRFEVTLGDANGLTNTRGETVLEGVLE